MLLCKYVLKLSILGGSSPPIKAKPYGLDPLKGSKITTTFMCFDK
jgi:hypothetical protein